MGCIVVWRLFKKIDPIIFIILLTVGIGIFVIKMRSAIYDTGYQIGTLKGQERQLQIKKMELESQLASTERMVRDSILNKKDAQGQPRYVIPDVRHVIKENEI